MPSENQLLASCALLFGPEVQLSREFLAYLQPGGLKSAYRRRVMATHPDRTAQGGEAFLAAQQAYALLLEYLHRRDQAERDRIRHECVRPQAPAADQPSLLLRPFSLVREYQSVSPWPTGERFYCGPMPQRLLRFGAYLYYAGLTNWRTISRILVWQRLNRPRLGEIIRHSGLLNETEVLRILDRIRGNRRFGETARALGLLSEHQVEQMLVRQLLLQKKFGTILVDKGLVNKGELQELLLQFRRHNARIRRQDGSRYSPL